MKLLKYLVLLLSGVNVLNAEVYKIVISTAQDKAVMYLDGDIRVGTSTSTANIILQGGDYNSGYMGVGTINPLYKIDSYGFIRSTAGFVCPDGSILTTANMSAFGDNLGNHIATTTLNMSNFNIINIKDLTGNGCTNNGGGIALGNTSTNFFSGVGGFNIVAGINALGNTNGISGASVALGNGTTASGADCVALGRSTLAGTFGAATAMGNSSTASGFVATAIGSQNTASGDYSLALGQLTKASFTNAIAAGQYIDATAGNSIILGHGLNNSNHAINNFSDSLWVVFNSTQPTLYVDGAAVSVNSTQFTPGLNVSTINYVSRLMFADNTVMTSTSQIVVGGDNLGNHTATKPLNMSNFPVINASSVTAGTSFMDTNGFSNNTGLAHVQGIGGASLGSTVAGGASILSYDSQDLVIHPQTGFSAQIQANTNVSGILTDRTTSYFSYVDISSFTYLHNNITQDKGNLTISDNSGNVSSYTATGIQSPIKLDIISNKAWISMQAKGASFDLEDYAGQNSQLTTPLNTRLVITSTLTMNQQLDMSTHTILGASGLQGTYMIFLNSSSNMTTTSTSYVHLIGTATFVISGFAPSNVDIRFDAPMENQAGQLLNIRIVVDSTEVAFTTQVGSGAGKPTCMFLESVQRLSPGTHNVWVEWKVAAGTALSTAGTYGNRHLTIMR